MRVVAVGIDLGHNQPVLLLQERAEQHRFLPVWVGLPEAGAIESERRHISSPRPTTHQLIGRVIDSCGRRVEHVQITALHDMIFHADLVLDGGTAVSARVSDAVALALHLGVPIRAADTVLDQAGLPDAALTGINEPPDDRPGAGQTATDADMIERFRRFVDNASPEDFA